MAYSSNNRCVVTNYYHEHEETKKQVANLTKEVNEVAEQANKLYNENQILKKTIAALRCEHGQNNHNETNKLRTDQICEVRRWVVSNLHRKEIAKFFCACGKSAIYFHRYKFDARCYDCVESNSTNNYFEIDRDLF